MTQPPLVMCTPASGSNAGGTSVTLTGTAFTGASGVTFGGTAATGIMVVNDTTITATTPAHAVGAVDVIVTTPAGSGTGVGVFTYFGPPQVSQPGASALTSTSATLGGSVDTDGGSAVLARGIVFALTSVNANPTLGGPGVVALTASGTTGTFTAFASGLSAGASYTFAAYATNAAGTSYSAMATFTTLTALEYWRQTWYGSASNTGNGADSADPYGTGLSNLAVFAFFGPAQNPATARISQLPQLQRSGGNAFFSFSAPSGVSGVTYRAQWTPALAPSNWQDIADTGSGSQHVFSVPTAGQPRMFLRLRATVP